MRQYSQLIQKIIQMQMLVQIYQQFLQQQLIGMRDEEVNPVMKSILFLHFATLFFLLLTVSMFFYLSHVQIERESFSLLYVYLSHFTNHSRFSYFFVS